MNSQEIIRKIEEQWSPSYALEWDNVGLLVGAFDKEIKHILVALDATDDVVAQAINMKADMIISHHPMIFSEIRKVTDEDFIGKRIITLIKNDISCYAAHTNFDVKAMADLNEASLELSDTKVLFVSADEDVPQGIGRVGKIKNEIPLQDFAKYVKQRLAIDDIRIFGNPDQMIKTVAISGGSGNSMVEDAIKAGADVLVSGDISHAKGLDAVSAGMAIIDAGHYGTECVFVPFVKETLSEMFSDVKISVADESVPFWTV
jgi:dinuclear metal center protein, YbgI/SA1388 family